MDIFVLHVDNPARRAINLYKVIKSCFAVILVRICLSLSKIFQKNVMTSKVISIHTIKALHLFNSLFNTDLYSE